MANCRTDVAVTRNWLGDVLHVEVLRREFFW
jgi:hypothetical protein